jgi:hypothetical protein
MLICNEIDLIHVAVVSQLPLSLPDELPSNKNVKVIGRIERTDVSF